MKTTEIQNQGSGRGHEVRDVDARRLLYFTLGFIAFAIIAHLVIGWMFFAMKRNHPHSLAAEAPTVTPRAEWPRPALEIAPTDEFEEFRAREDTLLHSYRLDRSSGAVRIPVERAMDLLIQENAAAQTNAPSGGRRE